jgi:hypothetical protein
MIITRPFKDAEIIVLKEFSSKEDTEILSNYLVSMYESQKKKDDSLKRLDLAEKSFEIMNKLDIKYKKFALENLNFPCIPDFTTLSNYVYWGSGEKMDPHYDNDPIEHAFPVMYGFVYYVTDDFDGGEIYYPSLGLSYKPVAGEMVIHLGTKQYRHGITEIFDGVRIAAAAFAINKTPDNNLFSFEY